MKKIEYEKCVVCHQETEVKKDEPIQNRQFYVVGAGQLCQKCFKEIYKINKGVGEYGNCTRRVSG